MSYNFNYQPQIEEEEIDLRELLNQIISIWPQILACVAIALFIAFTYLKLTVPEYEVRSKFFIKEKESALGGIFGESAMGFGLGESEKGLNNQMVILKSRPIANRALEKLNFDVEYIEEEFFKRIELYDKTPIAIAVDWSHTQLTNGDILIKWANSTEFSMEYVSDDYLQFSPNEDGNKLVESPKNPGLLFTFGTELLLPGNKFKVELTGTENEGELIIRLRDRKSLINQFTGDILSISPIDKNGTILNLSLRTETPSKGKDYLNTLQTVFLSNELNEKNETATNTIDFIDRQIVVLTDSLLYIENRLQNFRSQNAIYDLSNEGSIIYEKLSELELELGQEKFKRSYYVQLKDYLVQGSYNEIVVPSGLGIQDPILNSLIMNLIELQAEKSLQLSRLTETAPPVREVNRKIEDLNRSIREVLENVDQNSVLAIRDMEARIQEIQRSFSSLPQTEQNLIRIQREFNLNEGLYTFLLQRRAEAAITRASNTPGNKIIEDAIVSNEPVSPKTPLTYLIGLILGLIGPIGVFFVKRMFSNKFKELSELEKRSDLSIVAKVMQAETGLDGNLVVLNKPKSAVSESFRSLRANLNFILPKDQPAVISLTSSISGEGKTFCAINLASVYALSGKKTILIGCDLRKPKIAEDFLLVNDRGLSNYLSGHLEEIDQIIHSTSYENLDVIVSGPIPPNPAELLISKNFELLIQALKEEYEVIILDTPPVGLVSETLDLIQLSDICLFVVRYNYTQKSFVDNINSLKSQNLLRNSYMVFNGISSNAINYGYGYGYYAEDKKKEKSFWKKFV
jgi:capsular exopolysaccharide synthesis family protein